MTKVFVTRRIPKKGIEMLKQKGYELEVNEEDRVLAKKEIIKGVKGKDALLCLLTDTIDSDIIDAEPGLKAISNYAVGYNNIDVEYATKKKIPVTNTPGVLTDTTADLAFTLMMAAARRIGEGERLARAGRFKGWGPLMLLGQDIHGKTLGIIGAGRIGTAIAKRAEKGFGMKIIYTDTHKNERLEKEVDARFVTQEELLKESDFVTLHVPMLPETKHLISEKELGMMKKTAILINTSRGPVVDEKALIKALKEKKIFSAGLDVFENEPDIPKELRELENVVIVPHLGSASVETRTKMATLAAQNLIDVMEGRVPKHLVNDVAVGK